MTNGFEKHGLKHLSASQLNMFEACPSAWVAKYLFGHKFTFTVAPQIGVLVEDVVANTLTEKMGFDDAVKQAEETFNKNNALNTNAKDKERVSNIRDMAALAVEELKQYGKPDFPEEGQHKIELICNGDGFTVPIIGYLDFVYPEHGLVVDLKTTMRMPSAMSKSHLWQGSLYKQAMGNKETKFLYVTPKKAGWHNVEDHELALADIKVIATRMEKLLRMMSKEELRDTIPICGDSFYWSGDEAIRKEMYNV